MVIRIVVGEAASKFSDDRLDIVPLSLATPGRQIHEVPGQLSHSLFQDLHFAIGAIHAGYSRWLGTG
jgi:hypothetical protein